MFLLSFLPNADGPGKLRAMTLIFSGPDNQDEA